MSNHIHHLFHTTHRTLCALYPEQEAQLIAWELISFVTQHSKQSLLTEKLIISDEHIEQVNTLIYDHTVKQVPIAYLTQRIPFGKLDLIIREPILIPRPETEQWAHTLAASLQRLGTKSFTILDLCTGSGCIALTLAHALPTAQVTGVDISPAAVQLAQENSIKNNIKNCTWIQSDLFAALENRYDIIVANPPYIGYQEWLTLHPSVKNFESPDALIADDDGYALIQKIIAQAPLYLKYNDALAALKISQLYIEIGHNQTEKVEALMLAHAYANIELWQDYTGHTRVVCGRISHDAHSQNI